MPLLLGLPRTLSKNPFPVRYYSTPGITHLVLCGIATSGVVLSTLREAADKDYQLTVFADGCADADEEVHRVLLSKVFPRQAEILQIEEWITKLHVGKLQ
jgi:nicotinamidase-related amidase